MIANEPEHPAPSVEGSFKQTKPANSAQPRQSVKPSQMDGPYGGKKPQS